MSLVRPVELSATSYRKSKLYSLKGSNDTNTQTFGADKNNTMYTTDSYSTESYEFLDSPSEEVVHPSSSSISGSSFNEQAASLYPRRAGSVSSLTTQNPSSASFMSMRLHDAYQTNIDSDYLESQSPEAVSFDDGKMKLKLQELERALLDDNDAEDDEEMIGNGQSMEIDGEWTEPIQNALLHDSPKESSSSDSYLSSISSNKEISRVSPRTPKQLLFDCAGALSEGNIEEASTIINELRQLVSIQGDPPQRIAAYMVEGLVARMASSGKYLYRALKCKEPPSSYRLAAMQVLFEVCPCFKFGFMAANGAIIEATKDEKSVHIIDFDINQGNQYITLIQELAELPGKPPHLRLTGVDDPESVQRPVGGLNTIGQRLEQLAEGLGVSFEFQAVASKTSIVSPPMLHCRQGEALVINFAFQLHHMPDESVSTVNQRDQLLRLAKSLSPKLVTVVEQDVNTNTTPFFPRFVEAYNYYSAVFDSLEAAIPRESQDRMNVEKQCLARDIVNIVACEGEERIERYEVAGKWRARMAMAGFTSTPMSKSITDSIRDLIRMYCDRYKIKEEMGGLHFGWEDKSLIVASAWR
ncbi:putative transcription factor GRAS family [Rosa chinensis]|uniref:Putative transcription factor GRAS family n=1 Tax=Rosa chinensis TaxID=74649 RepID=A0A2P6PSL6_ROSCH|nr:scarecrow-like protein 1 [Rosa chinensis]XP_024167802.1 scarecrow-like protein 1 [Rosa chinensis]XP_024167803.1 scarecrow-like protein 1 [Rosa chinensis]XP_024167804.1 scarecrow-like protein 1 [Rosa chinensis]XP_040365406.1 scarecrow-like protein 1 [Rosa chinensis]XP_040365407.1 scarecrow-like protein 1 [Rosa chinensis]XP_040365408.1 scarecrow-like protein 1 [Rosa chinensis]XP_040365409.1 scarecrow-like protein 1 [Rosa chinensis]PRQ24901.1 putative transcription factor GRAS family [Rosa 